MFAVLTALCACTMPVDDKPNRQELGSGIESLVPGVPVAKPKVIREKDWPPVIVYPPSRRSTKFVDVGEYKVAVDEGVEWQGRVVYFSLTQQLVVVDAKSNKALWHVDESAFWDSVTFEILAKAAEPPQWLVALKSSAAPGYSMCYGLADGKRLGLRGGPPAPTGTAITPR